MKKIALYIRNMNGGGAEKVFMTLSNHFISKGYEVDLLLTSSKGTHISSLDKRVRVIELSSKKTVLDFFKLVGYLKNESPDVLLSGLTNCNLIASISSLFSRSDTRIYVTQHSYQTEAFKAQSPIIRYIYKALIGTFYRRANGLISVSEGVNKDLTDSFRFLKKRSAVINNPFDIPYIKRQSLLSSNHPWLNKHKNYKVIISAGRLNPAKDFENLLRAFAIVKNQLNVRLIILGEGKLKDDLSESIEKKKLNGLVDLYGFTENPFSFIAKADVFVASSKHEGLSNVIIESMICGVPIVSTDCPSGPAEILENGIWGKLVPTNNPEALADAICTQLNSNTKIDCSRRVQDFDKEKIGNDYLNFIFPS